jgi:hypothetical protein
MTDRPEHNIDLITIATTAVYISSPFPCLILLIILGLVEANTDSSDQSQINTRRNSNKVLSSQSRPTFTSFNEADNEVDVPSWNPKTSPLRQILVE